MQTSKNGQDTPIARLRDVEGVLFIEGAPLKELKFQPIVAPGVAKFLNKSSAQRWHERLGHAGQIFLKETIRNSIGLEGIDLSVLRTCETCHINKHRDISQEIKDQHQMSPSMKYSSIPWASCHRRSMELSMQ